MAEEVVLKRYWVSWIQPTDDHRPITYPPNKSIVGWWCSGYDSESSPIIVALIEAENLEHAKTCVKKDWPEMYSWRFIEERDLSTKFSNRFEPSDWMYERMLPNKIRLTENYVNSFGHTFTKGTILFKSSTLQYEMANTPWGGNVVGSIDHVIDICEILA